MIVTTGVTGAAERSRPRRSRWLVGAAAAAVLAVGAAGVFAVGGLTSTEAGGAPAPDELGLELMQAIENEDVLGMIDVLAPGERDVLGDPLVELVGELIRLDVLSGDVDLAGIAGIDVELSNETVRTVSTNVDDIANVEMSADAVIRVDGDAVPIGDLISDNVPDETMTELRGTAVTETEQLDLRMTAIEQDGRWYFSLFHTFAELARSRLPAATPVPVEGIGADGAETPEAAVDGMLDAIESLDLTGILRRLSPGEAAALQRYAPLFLDDATAELGQVPLDWRITSREFRVVGEGDTRTVFGDALTIEGALDGTDFTVAVADGCLRAEAEGESLEQCAGMGSTETLDEMLGDAPAATRFVELVTDAFADIDPVGIELRRIDGLWYVSPMSTVTEGLLAVLGALDRREIDAIVEQAPAAFEEFTGAIFGGFGAMPGEIAVPPVDDALIVGEPDIGGEMSADDLVLDEQDRLDGAWSDCYAEPDPTVARGCFVAVHDDGGPDLSMMPVVLRHPECGYEVAWGAGLYDLSDADFIASAEAARPCFEELVERGEIDEWELPSEITHLECFEGRNWYVVFDEPEYDERYFECVSSTSDG